MKKYLLSLIALAGLLLMNFKTPESRIKSTDKPGGTYLIQPPTTLSGIHDTTISGKWFKGNANTPCLLLQNCRNVTITNVAVGSTTFYGINEVGIQLYNCQHITIKYCYAENVSTGIYAQQSSSIVVNYNEGRNMMGPFPKGSFVQFDNVSGHGDSICFNHVQNTPGVGHPQDQLNVYQSNGLPGDSIMVLSNFVKGGQVINDSGGAAGIVLGDKGGSYQVARNNILVNPGRVGIQPQGGTHIKVDHNTIYSSKTPMSLLGFAFGNYSGAPSSDIYIGYNKVKWTDFNGHEDDYWIDPAAGYTPAGIASNTLNAKIDSTILPKQLLHSVFIGD